MIGYGYLKEAQEGIWDKREQEVDFGLNEYLGFFFFFFSLSLWLFLYLTFFPPLSAPEILAGSQWGKEADWWCFGCVIHEILSGFYFCLCFVIIFFFFLLIYYFINLFTYLFIYLFFYLLFFFFRSPTFLQQ